MHNLRCQAFPFDWIITPHFSTVYRVLQDNFSHFLMRNYLIAQADKVIDTYYGITFIHDFPTKLYPNGTPNTDFDITVMPAQVLPNFLNFLPQVKQKFDRRIERLQQILRSTQPVLFIRVHHIGKPEALAFTQFIKSRYPQLNFTLAAIHTDSNTQGDWHIPHVKSFYTNTFIPHDPRRWLLDHEWTRIFKQLHLLQ